MGLQGIDTLPHGLVEKMIL